MLSAIIVALFLGVPYLKSKYFTKQKNLHPAQIIEQSRKGGNGDA